MSITVLLASTMTTVAGHSVGWHLVTGVESGVTLTHALQEHTAELIMILPAATDAL